MLNIEYIRRQRKMTQAELSGSTRIATHFISLIENGRGIPTEDQARRLANALGIDPSQLLESAPELEAQARG